MKTEKLSHESENGNNANRLLGVVYIVNRVDDGERSYTSIEMIFNSKDKAEIHKQKLEEKYKDPIGFKYKHFYFEIDEEYVF